MISVDVTLLPTGKSYQADTYKYKTACTASFDAVYDPTENRYETQYAAAAIIVAAGVMFGVFITRKDRRLLCSPACLNKDDPVLAGHFETMNDTFELPRVQATDLETERSNALNKHQQVQRKRGMLRSLLAFIRRRKNSPETLCDCGSPPSMDSGVGDDDDTVRTV